jgi:hypothetical protein
MRFINRLKPPETEIRLNIARFLANSLFEQCNSRARELRKNEQVEEEQA